MYVADGVRMGLMLAAPAGNDIMYDDKLCEQGRNFCNKIWNAFRLVKGWNVEEKPQPEVASTLHTGLRRSYGTHLPKCLTSWASSVSQEALMAVYRLFWDEFSSWYLEMVEAGIRRQHRQCDIQGYDRIFRFAAESAPPVHAIYHRGAVAAYRRAPSRRVHHVCLHTAAIGN